MRGAARPLAAALLAVLAVVPAAAGAAEPPATWQVEQPAPPLPEQQGVEPSSVPISLGHIGDIEFYAPDRGALITSGNGSSIPPGVWFYNGVAWRELSNKCGATDGRIAWAGPDEFWTVSDGRTGQALTGGKQRPPIEDNTLCHFAEPAPLQPIAIVASYASVPFEASSYLAMHAAGCLSATDCWFGGEPLVEPETGAFQLHWNGHTLEPEPYLPEGHGVWDIEPFEGRLYESLRLLPGDRVAKVLKRPPPLRTINSEGSEELFETVPGIPPLLYNAPEDSTALDYLRLGAGGESLWAAAGPAREPPPAGSEAAGVTVIRLHGSEEKEWSTVISSSQGQAMFGEDVVTSVAGEPGGTSAWLGLDSQSDAANPSSLERARVVRLTGEGSTSDEATLPEPGDPHGPLGAAHQIVCPAVHDCWMTTDEGWLLHLATATEREHPQGESDPAFAGPLITFRPPDEGVPQEPSNEVPVDNSGNEEEKSAEKSVKFKPPAPILEQVPLLSDVHEKLIHRTTLELRFELAVKATVRLVAERRHHVVASSKRQTMKAGRHTVLLRLNPKRWPTKLNLQTHALAPLPTRSAANSLNTVTTSFVAPSTLISGAGFLP